MNDRNKKYNLGLDIGTGSVGWAIVDDEYNLLHAKKKNLWGIRLFDGAETAADRRISRSTRRRYRRRRNRINWLNEIFADELSKVDPSFLIRLNSSWVSKKDPTRSRDKYNLFIDQDYTDVEYHREFPTIFHLRKRLVEDKSQADLRLIYLAIHNILKYRGNFTYEHQKFDVSQMDTGLALQLQEFNDQLANFGIELGSDVDYKTVSQLLLKKVTPTQKIDSIVELLSPTKELLQINKQTLKLIVGNKADINKIFSIDSEDKSTLDLSANTVEQDLVELESNLTDEQFRIINLANAIYSSITLNDILAGQKYLSFAKVDQYCNHKHDLANLKTMWRETPDRKAVKKAKEAYDKYLHSGKYNIQDFYKDLTKFLEIAIPEDLAKDALSKMETSRYLLKQRTSENGVIPFQLNQNELIEIIDNQSKYYPFLKENKEKLLSILSFRIPYYVGPLQSDNKNPFAWMVKKSDAAVRPWNFDDVVDREKSSNKFIKRMTSTDTYLIGEPVLPKMSMIYQKYEVLNELNNLRIDDGDGALKLPVDIKQRIFNEVFEQHRNVTAKILVKWLIANSYYKNPQVIGLTDKTNFNSKLSTFHDFKKIFGEDFVKDSKNSNQLEQLIEWLTIFEDKQILKIKLQDSQFNYTPEQIKKVSSIRYQGWGRLSKKLLCEITCQTKIGAQHQEQSYSILDLMWAKSLNFMSILKSDKFKFEDKIQDYNLDKNQEYTPREMVDNIQTSPALKRGIWQSIAITQELVKFMRHAPEHIFIEFTRDDQISELTQSRNNQLNRLYNKIAKKAKSFDNDLKSALVPDKTIKDQLKDNKNNLASDRLMLYFLQMGKSLYSGKPLDINHLSNYQIDHILPQAYIKDDSLENRALVLAKENQHKASDLLLKPEVISQNINRWRHMKDIGLMGPKKFKNLTRTQVTENDQEHFISRQLVQTSQIIKNVSNILDTMYADQGTTCVETRAHLSTTFRHAFSGQDDTYHFQHPEFVKNRNVNDFHHAQDAYLACLLGLYQMKKYPTGNMLLIMKEYKKFFTAAKSQFGKKNKLPNYSSNGPIIGELVKGDTQIDAATGQIIWDQSFKKKVSEIFQYKQYNVTKRTEIGSGEFYNQTVYPKGNGKLIPLKNGLDPKIYGGYSGDNPAYIALLKIDDKKYKLIKVPIRLAKQIDEGAIVFQDWLESTVQHKKSVQLIKSKIPLGQSIYSAKNGHLALKSDREIINEQQLVLSYQYVALLTLMQKNPATKYDEILAFYDDDILSTIFQEIINKMGQFYPYYSSEHDRLLDNLDSFKELNFENQFNVLEQLLNLLHANSTNANLQIGNIKSNRFGRKHSSIDMKNTLLIFKSITDLYESTFKVD